ncbi:MAG: Trk system potassium transporter TrkA [Oscillospiraceae bacterium]|jgi:trk system potassium uptake protein TrkA|nr:Trk system potassium transporter TrkA [Oscillospiraceae bacterium]MDD7041923.1 Trk system potassium transporter TrkA [Oscillospiraceae bacterium]MDY2611611.1 Trk system potassium transporter TrkA [Oscillospiraceae bacterium]
MKIIVVGDGKVGLTLTEQLSKEEHDIVVIDKNPTVLQNSQETFDVMVVPGNGASRQVLLEAGAQDADLVIAATSADEINLLCCLTAKKLGCTHTIARVRNPEYAGQLVFLKDELGLSMVINPEATAAREMFQILQFPSFLNRDRFAKGRVEIVELKVEKGCTIIGKYLHELHENAKVKVLVCAVERGEQVYIPSGNFKIEEGDKIHVTAETRDLTKLIHYLGIPLPKMRDVVIVGGSRLGYYLANMLIQSGVKVKIIEIDYERCLQLSELLPRALIINGDGCQQKLLNEEVYGKADAVISLLNIDEVNLVISMYAKKLGVPKVIAKIDRIEYMNVFKSFTEESFISPKNLICNDVLRYVRAVGNSGEGSMLTLYRLIGNQVEAIEFLAGKDTHFLGVPFSKVPMRPNLLIASIRRDDRTIFPTGSDCIQLGDRVLIVTTESGRFYELNDIFL